MSSHSRETGRHLPSAWWRPNRIIVRRLLDARDLKARRARRDSTCARCPRYERFLLRRPPPCAGLGAIGSNGFRELAMQVVADLLPRRAAVAADADSVAMGEVNRPLTIDRHIAQFSDIAAGQNFPCLAVCRRRGSARCRPRHTERRRIGRIVIERKDKRMVEAGDVSSSSADRRRKVRWEEVSRQPRILSLPSCRHTK